MRRTEWRGWWRAKLRASRRVAKLERKLEAAKAEAEQPHPEIAEPSYPWGVMGATWWQDPRPPPVGRESPRARRRAKREARRSARLTRRLLNTRESRRARYRWWRAMIRAAEHGVPFPDERPPIRPMARKRVAAIERELRAVVEIRRAELNRVLAIESADEWYRGWERWSEAEDRRFARETDDQLAELWPNKTVEERRQVASWARKMPPRAQPEGPRPT